MELLLAAGMSEINFGRRTREAEEHAVPFHGITGYL